VHQALVSLPGDDLWRLGVLADWEHGPHLLTYRQTGYTFSLVADALGKGEPDGLPSAALAGICDGLLEASVPEEFKDASTSLAVDWTDLESFSRPPPAKGGECADPEAWWGHRKNNLLRTQDELFYGYYLSAAIMMRDESGPAIPEFARRATLSSCRHDPVRAFAPVLSAMPGQGTPLGDFLDVSGYARRTGAERGFATVKDPAASNITRGWCRLMGLAPLMLFTTTLLIVRNQQILAAWNTRQEENQRRAAQGLPPKTRRRRRKTLTALAAPGPP